VFLGSAAVMLMIFGDIGLSLWINDAALAKRVAPLVSVLALGTLFNGLMHMPYQLQLAHGWTSLTVWINMAAVAVIVPAMLWVIPMYGAIGAAWLWATLNTGYLFFTIYFMHIRLLPSEKWRWYGQDTVIPLVAAAATAGLLRWAMPTDAGTVAQLIILLIFGGVVLGVAALSAPALRHYIMRHFRQVIRPESLAGEDYVSR
jgi:O-antigen/teichoic acid export membrane protein